MSDRNAGSVHAERVTKHDVKARIEEFAALAGHEHVHKGMTSRDATENTEQLQVRQSRSQAMRSTKDASSACFTAPSRRMTDHAAVPGQWLDRVVAVAHRGLAQCTGPIPYCQEGETPSASPKRPISCGNLSRQRPWHFLYLLPDPHQHGSLRPMRSPVGV